MIIHRDKVLTVCACLFYAWILEWSYLHIEGRIGFVAMTVRDVETVYRLLGYLFIAIVAYFAMHARLKRPSDLAIWILFLTWVIPSQLLIYHVGRLPHIWIFGLSTTVLLSFIVLVAMCRLPVMRIRRFASPNAFFTAVLVFSIVFISSYVLYLSNLTGKGLTISVFDLWDVYERRLEAREVLEGRAFVGYAIASLGASLSPLAICFGISERRPLFVALGFVGLLSIFVLDGTKSSFFVPIMIAMFSLFMRQGFRIGAVLPCLLSLLVAISLLFWLEYGLIFVSSLFVSRMLIGKAITMGVYFETFFDDMVLFADTSLLTTLGIGQALAKSNMVGLAFGKGAEENWNGSAWAAMYGDLGFIGIILTSVITGFLLRVYDATLKHAPYSVVAPMAGYAAYVWSEAAVLTSLLTYGIALTIFLILNYPKVRRT
jgi:oligosaccharide repeat unit polymerase